MDKLGEPGEACHVYHPTQEAIKHFRDAEIEGQNFDDTLDSRRAETFTQTWTPISRSLERVLVEANASQVNAIVDYLNNIDHASYTEQIPVGLISISTASGVSSQIQSAICADDTLLINIPSSQFTNLKSVLKCIVSAIPKSDDPSHSRLLNYDLEALRLHADCNQTSKVLLYFESGESLDGRVLSDLVEVLSSWKDRIPFVLFFEISVSVDLFQEKLLRRAIRHLSGTVFEGRKANEILDVLFHAATASDDQRLWLGANVASMILERQAEHIQSARGFIESVKYCYMIHFYRSKLSHQLNPEDAVRITEQDLAHLHELKSMKAWAAEQTSNGVDKKMEKNINNPEWMMAKIPELLQDCRQGMRRLASALLVLDHIHECAPTKTGLPWSKLYVQGMSGTLADSSLMKSLLMSVCSMPSDTMTQLLGALAPIEGLKTEKIVSDLAKLIASSGGQDIEPLRSEYDIRRESLRTTVVAQKVSLSKHRASLSKHDEMYSKIVSKVDLMLKSYFAENLIDPNELCLCEIFVFNQIAPVKKAFSPRPRYAIERALSLPGSYLACDCCDPEAGGLDSTQPATAILYQLYLESGAIINMADLWSAFDAVIDDGGLQNERVEGEFQAQKLYVPLP